MSFWQNVQQAAGFNPPGAEALLWVILGLMAAAVALFFAVPNERRRLRAAAMLFVLAFAGLLACGVLLSYGADIDHPDAIGAAYRWTRWASMFVGGIAIINVASVLLFDVVLMKARLSTPRIMRDLLLGVAYIVAGFALLSSNGFNLTGVLATSAIVTAVIGLSFQDTLGNMMGGLALQLEGTIGAGDWVRIDQNEGRVKEIRWRHTSIETRNWDTIVIPNSVLMRGQVTLLGRRSGAPQQHRQWVYFNVDFRYAPSDVIDTVEAALRAEPIPNIAPDPKPNCVFMDFKESYGSYAVRYWLTDLAVDDPTNSVVRSRIYFALRRAGIPLSIPAQSLFITADDASRRERKQSEEIGHRIETLQRVEIFHPLTEEERRELAGRLRVAPFIRGEAMTRQGAEAHSFYIIIKGEAEVRISVDGNNLTKEFATLHEGDFFGEMGLMTGEPRAATVIALTDVECYRLDKDGFDDIVRARPEIAEDMSHILARRRVQLEAVREGLNEEAMRQRMQSHQGDLLDRIRRFFTLERDNGRG